MEFVFPSPVTMITRKKCQNYFRVTTNDTVKCRCSHQKKIIDFNYREEYLKGVYQIKYYFGSVKKNTISFSSDLQTDKKINNVNEDPRRKTELNFINKIFNKFCSV